MDCRIVPYERPSLRLEYFSGFILYRTGFFRNRNGQLWRYWMISSGHVPAERCQNSKTFSGFFRKAETAGPNRMR